MSNIQKVRALTAAFAVLFLMNSCADFFSTSWGEFFKRDPQKVRVTASNVYDLLDTAKGNPELAKAILDKIYADVKPDDKSADADTLRNAAIKAANQAAGISTVALENIKDLINAVDGNDKDKEKALQVVANNILGDIKDNGIVDIADKMVAILEGTVGSPEPLRDALKNAGNDGITVSVPNATSNGATGTITIKMNDLGTPTAIVTVGSSTQVYPCEIDDDNGTIILAGAGETGGAVVIEYAINDKDRTLTLDGLDEIADITAASSEPSETPVPYGKPEFQDNFAAGVPGSDLTLLAMTLVLAKAEKEREKTPEKILDRYLETWHEKSLETGMGLDQDEVLIVAVINEMMAKGEDMTDLTDMIKKLLGVD
jgi:hypothetical protein